MMTFSNGEGRVITFKNFRK